MRKTKLTAEQAVRNFAEATRIGRVEYEAGRKEGVEYNAAQELYRVTYQAMQDIGLTQEEIWALVKQADPGYVAMKDRNCEAFMRYMHTVLEANDAIRQYERKHGVIL